MHFKHFYYELTVEKHLDARRFNIASYHKTVMKNALLSLLSEKKMQLGVKAMPTATTIAKKACFKMSLHMRHAPPINFHGQYKI